MFRDFYITGNDIRGTLDYIIYLVATRDLVSGRAKLHSNFGQENLFGLSLDC